MHKKDPSLALASIWTSTTYTSVRSMGAGTFYLNWRYITAPLETNIL